MPFEIKNKKIYRIGDSMRTKFVVTISDPELVTKLQQELQNRREDHIPISNSALITELTWKGLKESGSILKKKKEEN
jgi:hypothetical protein